MCYIGGFEDGQTASYNGSVIVERALQLSQPVVYVSVNYRYVAKSYVDLFYGSHCTIGFRVRSKSGARVL